MIRDIMRAEKGFMRCPKCKNVEIIYGECPKCRLTPDTEEFMYWENVYTSELRADLKENKNKLKKRGVQIADLKHRIKEYERIMADRERIDRIEFQSQGITGEEIKNKLIRLNKNYKA